MVLKSKGSFSGLLAVRDSEESRREETCIVTAYDILDTPEPGQTKITRLKRRNALRSRKTSTCCLFLLVMGFLLPASMPAYAGSPKVGHQRHALADFPTVDPNYIYDQLFYMATSFQHREAGYDNNLPVNINGHDEFASYWSQEMVKNLAGFGPQIRIDKFPVQGWQNRPAILSAFNVKVSVPGVTHP